MAAFEDQVQKAVDARQIPGVILQASDAKGKHLHTQSRAMQLICLTGTFKYEKAFGPKTPTEPMDLNATFIFASCTKLMTSIAVLQCVERGQITLDEPVSSILPELREKEIITGFNEDGSLAYQKAKNAITLR